MSKFRVILGAFVAIITWSGTLHASDNKVDNFINDVQTVVYDCPTPELQTQLDAYLSQDSLTEIQRFALATTKSHYLLCDGQPEKARELLNQFYSNSNLDETSYSFVSGIYLLGYSFDMNEEPERCGFYSRAKQLSSPDLHSDVFLSASMGLINYCSEDKSVSDRLGSFFSILESYSNTQDFGALATIHNNIGLAYGELDQHGLAAEQYLKAHEMGLNVYKGSNQLSILISAISSLFASGQFDKAFDTINEFERINQSVDTPLTNFFYYYALTGYYYRTEDIAEMERVLPQLQQVAEPLSGHLYHALVDWYTVAPCVYHQDVPCIEQYLNKVEQDSYSQPSFFTTNMDYLGMRVKMYAALGDLDKAMNAFLLFSDSSFNRRRNDQYSASVISAANLYSKIYELESEIQNAEQMRQNIVAAGTGVIVVLMIAFGVILRRKQLSRLAIDPVTELLNSETAINRISKIDNPDEGRANALAIFDLGNFREINRAVGSTKGDYVLRQIANTLRKVTRGTDILGRFAPEQFILCLQNIEESSAKAFFERVQNELDNTFEGKRIGEQISVRSSMSIFITSEKLMDLNDVLDEMLLSINVKTRH